MNTVEERRAWYIEQFGSVRHWALYCVTANWRIRKRLPRLTARAKQLGVIE
ncbi:hypothetical protein pf16_237 [Pseudomonas phage pf16]|uniref:Uncharacterized protein n=1 Tax=Pseudomonas phage pf16 TaxID=1815630 RepID=A0A1S5R646_9CAUD|nr:hypothetical protein FDG98_gp061 [Pseudomonas phage pf16]AND75160.1 hypothetical protein pf16_237 [Pseudomonas phage pf16]